MAREERNQAETARHRALADPTRARIVTALRDAAEPLDARALASSLGLHVSTIRWHLGLLVDGGVVSRRSEPRTRPGRPRVVFELIPVAAAGEAAGAGLLADVLAGCLARAEPNAARLAEEAGRERGRSLVRPAPAAGAPKEADVEAELVRLLGSLGFAPIAVPGDDTLRIDMRPCPFGRIAADYPTVVCPIHRGLIEGALETLGAPLQMSRLDPFVAPDLCVAYLERAARGPAAPV